MPDAVKWNSLHREPPTLGSKTQKRKEARAKMGPKKVKK